MEMPKAKARPILQCLNAGNPKVREAKEMNIRGNIMGEKTTPRYKELHQDCVNADVWLSVCYVKVRRTTRSPCLAFKGGDNSATRSSAVHFDLVVKTA